MKKMKKVLFIHIPKTAGNSIKVSLKNNNYDNEWKRVNPFGHDSYFDISKNNIIYPSVFSFTVVRNPFEWIYSYYRFILQSVRMNINKDSYFSFYYFLSNIKHKQKLFPSFNNMLNNQSYYFINESGKICVNKVYRYENIKELETDLDISLGNKNVGDYSKEEYIKDYTKKNIDLVKEIYARDFRNLGYSDEFT
jgi:hypothetical protein